MFTGSIRAQSWHVRCVAMDGHTGDFAQHIYAKLNLILIVVLISRSIRLWKKNSPRTIENIQHSNLVGTLVSEKFISIVYFKPPFTSMPTFTWLAPPGSYRAMICRKRELTLDHIHTFWPRMHMEGLPDEWSAQCRGHVRDNTNIKDDTHIYSHIHSHKAKTMRMVMVAKWYSRTWLN